MGGSPAPLMVIAWKPSPVAKRMGCWWSCEDEGVELFRESASEEVGVWGGGCNLDCCRRSRLLLLGNTSMSPLPGLPVPPPPFLSSPEASSGTFTGGTGGEAAGSVETGTDSLPEPVAPGMPARTRAPKEGLRLPMGKIELRPPPPPPSLSFLSGSLSRSRVERWLEAKKEVERSMLRPVLGSTWGWV
eukprot:1136132-Pelagomonas_calceolata.AAC.3